MIVVDAMNVRGAVPDGWWNNKDAALRRLMEAVTAHDWNDEWVIVVADGHPVDGLPAGTSGNVELRYAGHTRPNAADDVIVSIVADEDPADGLITVVTSDRGLRERLPRHVAIDGARTFRNHVGW
ncbi:MAG: NYN domain-containing protein [Actinomycetota bacterium]